MKNFILVVLLTTMQFALCQNGVDKKPQAKKIETGTLHGAELDTYSEFVKGLHADSCISACDFRQNCKVCSDIFLTFKIETDMSGKVIEISCVKREVDCIAKKSEKDKKCLEDCMKLQISKKTFPAFMRSAKFEMRVGRPTRC